MEGLLARCSSWAPSALARCMVPSLAATRLPPPLPLLLLLLVGSASVVEGVPTVPKPKPHGGGAAPPEQPGAGEPDKRWFKKWRGERPGLEKGEQSFHAPRPVDFDVDEALKALPVTDEMVAQWDQEEDQPVASFAYTVALALGGVASLPERAAPGFASKVTIHAIGAAKYREARIEDTFGALCQVLKLNPQLSQIAEIDIVLVGPTLSLGPTKDAAPVIVEAAGCRTSVSVFSGGYSEAVLKEFPDPPDVVVGFDVDAYTCSWRKSLLYIIENQLPTVFSFMMPHEALWVEELLAEPGEAFGKPSHAECAADLEKQRKMLAKEADREEAQKKSVKGEEGKEDGGSEAQKKRFTAMEKRHTVARDEMSALMEGGSADDLLNWKPVESSYEISHRIDVFISPFDEAPMVGNNPFGGKKVTRGVTTNGLIGMLPPSKTAAETDASGGGGGGGGSVAPPEKGGGEHEHEHDKNVRAIFGHPNSHLLGFLVVAATASDTTPVKAVSAENQKKAGALLHTAKTRMQQEGRPLVSRWTAMDTNRAIREKVPGWTANLSLKHALAMSMSNSKHGGGGGGGGNGGGKGAEGYGGGGGRGKVGGGEAVAGGLFGKLKAGMGFGKTIKRAKEHVTEEFIEEKAALTEATGLLPKKHADFDLFKKQMLPKMALQGGAKADAAESTAKRPTVSNSK